MQLLIWSKNAQEALGWSANTGEVRIELVPFLDAREGLPLARRKRFRARMLEVGQVRETGEMGEIGLGDSDNSSVSNLRLVKEAFPNSFSIGLYLDNWVGKGVWKKWAWESKVYAVGELEVIEYVARVREKGKYRKGGGGGKSEWDYVFVVQDRGTGLISFRNTRRGEEFIEYWARKHNVDVRILWSGRIPVGEGEMVWRDLIDNVPGEVTGFWKKVEMWDYERILEILRKYGIEMVENYLSKPAERARG